MEKKDRQELETLLRFRFEYCFMTKETEIKYIQYLIDSEQLSGMSSVYTETAKDFIEEGLVHDKHDDST